MVSLQEQWLELAQKYCEEEQRITQYWRQIESAYKNKNRLYHNLSHIESLLTQASKFKEHIKDFDSLCFAIWYHDIIYKVSRKDNELKSAVLAKERLAAFSLSAKQLSNCFDMIIATKGHDKTQNPDVNWMLDFDLSILGAKSVDYQTYTQQIRREYKIFPDLIYKPGRRKVLQHFLNLERIFKTEIYFELFEEKARKNLQQELNTL